MIILEILGIVMLALCLTATTVFLVALCLEFRKEDKILREMRHCKNCIYHAENSDGSPYCLKGMSIVCVKSGFKYKEERIWRK